jgi:RND family efflux transporter MFP subunit
MFSKFRAGEMNRMQIWAGAALVGIGLAALSACEPSDNKAAEAETPAIPVRVATAEPAPDANAVSVYGTVRSDKEATLSFKIGGLLKTLDVDAGDHVKKGEVLARLNQSEIDAETARAKAAYAKAEHDLARIKPLLASGFVSKQRSDDAISALAIAKAELARVNFDRSLSTITAPADGVVLARHVDKNEIVAAGSPVLTVSQGGQNLIFKAALSDRDVAKLKLGDKATIYLDAFRTRPISGHVRLLSAMSDAQTGTFGIEILLDDTPEGVKSGFMGKALITPGKTGPQTPVLAIPSTAILEGHGATATVYVIDENNIARLTRVTLGGLQNENVLVSKGLKQGDKVVSAGAAYLRDSAHVQIVTGLVDLAADKEPRK